MLCGTVKFKFIFGGNMKIISSTIIAFLFALLALPASAEPVSLIDGNIGNAEPISPTVVEPNVPNESSSSAILEGYVLSEDKSKYLSSLTEEKLSLFKSAIEVSSVETSFTIADASVVRASFAVVSPSCYVGTAYRWAENIYGGILWKMGVKGTWCGLFDKVTSASVTSVYPVETGYLWIAGGLLEKGSTIWSNSARIFGQYQFNLNLAGWNAQSSYPCIRITGQVSGKYGSSNSCGPY
jgi:hypothetical protein